jgi:hypothetical protein
VKGRLELNEKITDFKRMPEEVKIRFRRLDLSKAQKEIRLLYRGVIRENAEKTMAVYLPTKEIFPLNSLIELIFDFQDQNREVRLIARLAMVDDKEQGIGVEVLKTDNNSLEEIVQGAKRNVWHEQSKELEPRTKEES